MKRKFTLLIAALALLTMIVQPGRAWGQSDYSTDYTGNISLSTAGGTNASDCVIAISGTNYAGIKAGTSSKVGAVVVTVPSGTKYLHIHAAAWNGTTASLAVTPEGYSDNISLTANSGIANNSPFTFNGDASTSDYYKVITFSDALTANTDLTFTAVGGKRFVIWGVTSEEESSGDTPSITADNVQMGCLAQGTSISYEIDNYVEGTMSAATEATWITNLEASPDPIDPSFGSIEVTTTINESLSARTATVTLTYTYGAKATVTKNVTVTQAGNPNASGGANNPYTVAQAIAAIDAQGTIEEAYATGIVCQVDSYNSTYSSITYWISDDGTTTTKLQVYSGKGINGADFSSINDVQVGATVVIKGKLKKYNSTYEFDLNNQLVSYVAPVNPIITVTPATVNAPVEGANGILTVTYENITTVVADVWFCNAAGTEAATYDWITADINADNNVEYLVEANDGAARTAYFKVWAYDDDDNEVYSNLVTISQDEYVAPTYAELPFSFNGGKADIEGTDGLSQEGLGSDYSSNPKLKFDSTDDWVLLQFDERPGTLTFDIKGNSFSGGTFTIQTSVDGVTYTDLQAYTELGDTQSVEFGNLAEDVRYIKWIYTNKVSGNVGLGNIGLTSYVAPVPSIEAEDVNIAYNATAGEIAYTINNPVEGGHFDAVPITGGDRFEIGQVSQASQGVVPFTCPENTEATEQTATIELRYTYNNTTVTKEVTITQAAAPQTASIVVEPAAVSVDADAHEEAFTVTYTNVDSDLAEVQLCDENGDDATYNWLIVDFNSETDHDNITCVIDANTGDARTAYFKIYGLDVNGDDVYSDIVTVYQAAPVADYATLPFEWEGGPRSEFEALNGTSTYSVGDYGDNQGVYRMKLDNNGDYIQVKTNEQPGIVTVGVKMIGGASTSTITVQGSADGTTFTNVEALTISGSQNDELTLTTTNDFAATDRYVRLLFTKGSNVGVGPITIAQVDLTPSITVAPASLNLNCDGGDGELTVTHKNLADDPQLNVIFVESDGETITTCDWIQASINTAGNVAGHINANTGEARTAYLKVTGRDADNNLIKSNLVTFNQSAYTEPSIVFENTTLDIVAGGENRTMSFDYEGLGQDPTFSINFYESDGTTTATYDWIEAEITQDDKVDITVSANEGAARSAYFKVQGVNGAVSTESNLVTINQEAYVSATTYTLATTIEPGLHYIIAGNNKGEWFAMGTQNNNNRAAVSITVNDNVASVTSNDVHEFVISGDSNNNYTIYDENDNTTGYLYAASSSSNYLKTRSNNNDGNSQWAISFNEGVASIVAQGNSSRNVMQFNSSSSIFACYGSANQSAVYLYKKDNDSNPVYYSPTEVPVVDPDPTTTTYIVANNEILVLSGDLSNCTNPDNLIIEDGGQLVFSGTGVQATMKKSTAHAGAKDVATDWYTIASPLSETVTTSTSNTNLTTSMSSSEYDLYRYNEATAVWENSKDGANSSNFSEIELGRGYLYWREDGQDLIFAGELNNENVDYTLTADGTGNLKGFNLIGNPFSQNITMSNITGVTLSGGYVLTQAGGWGASIDEIAPCQGFLVQVEAKTDITITKPTSSGKSRANRDYLAFTVANAEYEDVAYAMFEEATGLSKINHRNADIPMVYIPQNGQNYAIATMDDNTQAFELNFKAMTTGQYTLSYKAEGKYSYLHVIDRLTGEDIDMLLDGEYSFIGSPRDNEARFIVKLSYNANIDEIEVNDNFAYQNGSDIIVNGNGELQVFDVTGRMVMNTNVNGIQTVNVPTTGMYIFRMVGESVQTQKIVVK